MSRTRKWFAQEAQLTADPAIEQLGLVHGPAGPLVWVVLLGLTALAADGGAVTVRWEALRRRAFVKSTAKVKAIIADLAAAAEPLIEIDAQGRDEVSLTVLNWAKWQPEKQLARDRKAKQRSRDGHDASVTSSDPARDVSRRTDTDTDTGLQDSGAPGVPGDGQPPSLDVIQGGGG